MPSRIIRAEILDSDRWLGLAHVSERMAYIVLLLSADDLGTLDAGLGSLSRKWREPCQIKGTEDAAKILQALMDADLVRTYQADGNTYAFLPRFHPRFRATTFRRPPPPPECLHGEPSVSVNILVIQKKDSTNDRQKTVIRPSTVSNVRSSAPDVDVDVSSDVDVEKRSSKEFAPPVRKKPRTVEAVGSGETLISIPAVGNEVAICETAVKEWEQLFPSVDVPQTLREIRAWCLANTEKRKTTGGIHRFVTRWLTKEQNHV
jgi:hypothetical protein